MENKKDFNKSDLSVFVSYIIPHKKLFAVDMLLSILIAGVDLTFPFITRTATGGGRYAGGYICSHAEAFLQLLR